MNVHPRPIERWFASYSDDHRNPTNQRIHLWCVPAIVWSVIALLWCIPAPGTWFRDGFWAGMAMFASLLFYYRASRQIGLGMLITFVVFGLVTGVLFDSLGRMPLLWLAVAVFAVAWVGQFIGHKLEGRKPSFLTDLTYLLIGPAWVLGKLYRRFGWAY